MQGRNHHLKEDIREYWSERSRTFDLAIGLIDRVAGIDPHYDGAMSDRHQNIMGRLPFGAGLTVEKLAPLIEAAGFEGMEIGSHQSIAAAQRQTANLRNRLRTLLYRRFVLCCTRPQS